MTKTSLEKYFEVIQEASEKELSEASSVPQVVVEERQSLPNVQVSIPQDQLTSLLVQREEEALKQTKQQTQHTEEIHDTRKTYTQKLYRINLWWIIVVAAYVFFTGVRFPHFNDPNCQEICFAFTLSENILIAFITSTTATVIGIFIIVANWLYPSARKEAKDERK